MEGENLNLSHILPTILLGGILVLSGCNDNNGVYNPDRIQEEAQADFPVKNIDPNQTWETSAVCNASVSVNEDNKDTYTIKVYTANPYYVDGDATLLAQTTVTDGQIVNFKFDVPAALQYLYVMKINSKGYSSAIPVAVKNKTVKVTFGEGGGTTRAISGKGSIQGSGINLSNPPRDLPEGSIKLSTLNNQWTDVTENGNYIVTSDITEVNIGKPVHLYIEGNVTLSKLYIQKPWDAPVGLAKIYLLPHSKLTLIADKNKAINNVSGESETIRAFSMESGYEIGITREAELICENAIIFNANTNINNRGKISATHLEFNNNSQLLNNGEVALTNLFSCENGRTVIENNYHITAGSFHLAGSSAFYNETLGEVMINGLSNIDSNSSTWYNDGLFHTTNITFNASSPNWINKCRLYVDEKFTYDVSNNNDGLIMDAGSYVQCGTFYADQANIRMGNKSFFNVIGEARFNHNPIGFVTTGDDYALLKMGSAVQEDPMQGFSITYDGKLYVACSKHFAQGNDGSPERPLISIKNGAEMTKSDKSDIIIEHSHCNPGYKPNLDDKDNEDKLQTYAYAFEDMAKGVGDYDFNDVVLYVTVPYNKDGKKVIDVTLKAAGASKQLAVLFNNKTIFGNVHEALGVPTGTLVNTGQATGTAKTETIEVGSDFNLTTNGDFYISDGKSSIHIPNFTTGFMKGNIPYALRIANVDWKWPKEKISIAEAYTNFEKWAQDTSAELTWYKIYDSNKVMN